MKISIPPHDLFLTLAKNCFFSLFCLVLLSDHLPAEDDCRIDCPPRDDGQFLQSIIDACRSDVVCEFPKGTFQLSGPLEITKSLILRGAGGGPRKKPSRSVTEIQVIEGNRVPAFKINATESDIRVQIQDLLLTGGGIHVGGQKDPCRGIDDPFGLFGSSLLLKDVTIIASLLDSILFEGTTLSLEDVKVANNVEGTGLYVANATGDIVVIDGDFVDNERWGVYICNMEGTGQIFMNDVSANDNERGGIAIVGKGTAPTFRTLCMQNTGTAFNKRFGVLLFDVAKSLLFNIGAGFTFSEPGGRFGDGIAVSASHDVLLWDASAVLNQRAGFSAFGPDPAETTHVHLVGDISAIDNTINAVVEGQAFFDAHTGSTSISGLCGFTNPITAPPIDAYCEQNQIEVGCGAEVAGMEFPDPSP